MNPITEQWVRFAAVAEQNAQSDIYCFYTAGDRSYSELRAQLKEEYENLVQARDQLQQLTPYAQELGVENAARWLAQVMEEIDSFSNTMHLVLFQEQEEDYGRPYEKAWRMITAMTAGEAEHCVKQAEMFLRAADQDEFMSNFDAFLQQDPYRLLMCIWACALDRNYRAEQFNSALHIYERLFCENSENNPDIAAAQLYVQKQYAGEDAVRNALQQILNNGTWGAVGMQVLASAMNWMQCYQCENLILTAKLGQNLSLLPVEQIRLQALSEKDDTPQTIQEIPSNFSFDVSALSWDVDDYAAVFNKLQTQGKLLPYALAVRASEHSLRMPKGFRLPDEAALASILSDGFDEEYDGDAAISCELCTALSNDNCETYQAYLARCDDCPGMGILTQLIKIGRNLNIKLYTLYLPQKMSAEQEKKQALNLKKELSSSAHSWESSLTDTILLLLQQVLNSTPAPAPAPAPLPTPEPELAVTPPAVTSPFEEVTIF